MQNSINIVGYASGNAAENHACCMGPLIIENSTLLKNKEYINWLGTIFPTDDKIKLQATNNIATCCEKLGKYVASSIEKQEKFVVIGGDHSCAIGTWSGAAMAKQGPIGMIWIDAHLDSHNDKTSLSKNIHGMALSSLIGYGPEDLNKLFIDNNKIDIEHLTIIGARDFETAEKNLIDKLGIKVFYMNDVLEYGLEKILLQAISVADKNPNGFGISLDIDSLDPKKAPATAIHTQPGLDPDELTMILQKHISNNEKLLGLEIAEFFPELDIDKKTEKIITDIIQSCFFA